jgi:lipopolysaccharide transport system ATP-binding protein
MTEAAISIENLGKKYRIKTIREDELANPNFSSKMNVGINSEIKDKKNSEKNSRSFFKPYSRGRESQVLWALRNVSFDVPSGEVIGIIGRNGSGKSTLLKILSQITEPTEGRVKITGRSASLLEVGTGFHPELTGRENVYLNGSILGMKRREIDSKFEEIVAFSEIEKFIDTPVKRYSSGMGVRLAFAVAAHLEPEILFIDEVLAVGDLKFQRKCLDKMQSVVKEGRTILFVTHQMNAVRRLCSSCVWLENGSVKLSGPTASVVSAYETASLARAQTSLEDLRSADTQFLSWSVAGNEPGNEHLLETDGPFSLAVRLFVRDNVRDAQHGIALWSSSDELMWSYLVQDLNLAPGIHEIQHHLPGLPLRPSTYRWHFSLYDGSKQFDEWYAVPEMIIASAPVTHPSDQWIGILNIQCESEVKQIS